MTRHTLRRIVVAVIVLLHALAHASIGVWAVADHNAWVVEPLWGLAMLGYFAAAFGILGVPMLRDRWKEIIIVATCASILLMMVFANDFSMAGVLVDIVILVMAMVWERQAIDEDVDIEDSVGTQGLRHPRLHRVAWSVAVLFLFYAAVVVAIRPLYLRWGSTEDERMALLPGDDLTPDARYRVDHAITINAPASAVWPWIAQLGQDRGGFYSYAWLERLIGDDIHNADRIHPEWQQRQPGDFVRAAQPNYLGGRLGDAGWWVADVVPGRALVLRDWGAFVVEPVNDTTSRLIVRTRESGEPSLLALLLGPINVFVFEPAHFIMQRGMLRGVRDRAERSARG